MGVAFGSLLFPMATGGATHNGDYLVLQEARAELQTLLVKSETDLNVLITKAESKGLIDVKRVEASSAAVDGGPLSRQEKASQLMSQVLKAVEADENGEKAIKFVQLLEDNSLGDMAALLRGKLAEQANRYGADRESDRGELPKLEAVSMDSGFYRTMSNISIMDDSRVNPDGNSPDEEARGVVDKEEEEEEEEDEVEGEEDGVEEEDEVEGEEDGVEEEETTSSEDESAVPFYPEQYSGEDHTDNLQASNPGVSIPETQPPDDLYGSRRTVLPETTHLHQQNLELQAKLAEKEEQLQKTGDEKREAEKKLQEKEKELEKKDAQIKQLKSERESLKQKLHNERENHTKLKKQFEEKIEDLTCQLSSQEEKFQKERITLIKEKHALEIKIEKMNTKEEKLKRKIVKEKYKYQKAENDRTERTIQELQEKHKEQMERKEREHRNSCVLMENEIAELRRRNSTKEPDTS